MPRTVDQIFDEIVKSSVDTRQRGTRWEYAVKYFLENDPAWSERLVQVWMWGDAPTNPGKPDTGIDLVALDEDGQYWAIQAKCYESSTLSEGDVSTFFMNALADERYGHFMIADTAPKWSKHLQKYVDDHPGMDFVRLDLDTIKASNLDWEGFVNDSRTVAERATFDPRPHQRVAIDKAKAALSENDRATLVMACGTGKTLTSLRFVEEFCPGGMVLFLAPSISLVGQTMRNWVNQTRSRINVYVVCSDPKAANIKDEGYGVLTDVPFPATTNAGTLTSRFDKKPNVLNVVFSTYQSIKVIHEAQQMGMPEFDMIVCDEAHRTTGRLEENKAESSAFVMVHDNEYVVSKKRLYMTATARVYAAREKETKALSGMKVDEVVAASMDDQSIYGPICHTLSFGDAVSKGLLTDYKIVIMQISQSMMPATVQSLAANSAHEIEMPNAAKFIGIWKAMFDRRHAGSVDDVIDDEPSDEVQGGQVDDAKRVLHHAIAFASSIKASKQLSNEFNAVIQAYIDGLEEEGDDTGIVEEGSRLNVSVDHVDGGMDSATRKGKLDWLAGFDDEGESCRILSNARCLAEGIDVPSLDAVIYLSSRKSKVDIIQSVGRVMRKAPGKQYGYIVIPVFVAAGVDPGEALAKSPEFKTIYDVIAALRSHDERLDAKINAAALGDTEALRRIVQFEVLDPERLRRKPKPKTRKPRVGESEEHAAEPEDVKPEQTQLILDDDAEAMAKAINAQIVKRCGTKIYWSEWSSNVGKITQARAEQIAQLITGGPARIAFLGFLDGLRDSLNDSQTEQDAIDILAQHEVTRPIFQALFDSREVLENNPIVQGLDRALESLYEAGLPASINDPDLAELYTSVKVCVSQITTDEAKQNLIKEIYNDFFKAAFKSTSDKLGIVYTPVECVDAQLHMVQRALRREFGANLGDRGVHILDGFAGTGTYMCRLIEDESLISDEDLPYKYEYDLHSNEIVPLAATIMDINIEQSYHKRMGGDYKAFPGALLTDTFQMHEDGDTLDVSVFTENSERIKEQLDADITVIIGNPPYRAGDKDNTGNQNTKYKTLDKRIEETYVAKSDATLNNSLYNHYIRAFRWASDRIKDRGIVCFISGAGWVRGASGAGIRRCLEEEFNSIYILDLRGNKEFRRLTREQLKAEGDNVFGSGSKSPIAITMLVKNPNSPEHGQLHYRDIGDYLTRKEKLDILKHTIGSDPIWDTSITLDQYGDWLNQRDDSFYGFAPMGIQDGTRKLHNGLFSTWSSGVKTNRDPWCYNFLKGKVVENMRRSVETYLAERERWHQAGRPGDVKSFVTKDETLIKWTREVYGDLGKDKESCFRESGIRTSTYRPFCKQWLYMDSQFNNCTYQQPKLFPHEGAYNLEISMSGTNSTQFSCLMVRSVPDLELNQHSQCFPLYRYEKAELPEDAGTLFGTQGEVDEHGYVRHEAITDTALAVFRAAYPGISISKEDIFYYVYGLLHSPEYRKRFASNLEKELPRIPLARDFSAFIEAGRKLAHLHLDYEELEPWPLVIKGDVENPGRTEKMEWGKKRDLESGKKVKDFTVLKASENVTYAGIPERAQDYVVNGKSALGWLVDRYKVTTDKKSGIVNDPNDYSDDPRYIVDLVAKVVRASMETLDIVESLPPLEELPQPANWPMEWTRM